MRVDYLTLPCGMGGVSEKVPYGVRVFTRVSEMCPETKPVQALDRITIMVEYAQALYSNQPDHRHFLLHNRLCLMKLHPYISV